MKVSLKFQDIFENLKFRDVTPHAKHFLQRTSEKAYISWVGKDWLNEFVHLL